VSKFFHQMAYATTFTSEERQKVKELTCLYDPRARLDNAILRRADLRGARLAYAVLSNADLRFAVLDGADLSGANLSGAWMMAGDLEVQINDGSVWSG